MDQSNDEIWVTRVVRHKARAGREDRFLEMMQEVAEVWKKHVPEISVRRFRSATAARGVFIALVTFRAENLHHFYEWSGAALEKEWGKAETEQYLDEYYGCLEESQQIAVVTETP